MPNARSLSATQARGVHQPGFVPTVPRLHSGPALVQLCIFDNIVGDVDTGTPGGFALNYTMQEVHAGNGIG